MITHMCVVVHSARVKSVVGAGVGAGQSGTAMVDVSESLILSETPTLRCMMHQVLCGAPHKPTNTYSGLRLLYRGSRDGFRAEAFHQRCDNKQAPTLTVIREAARGFVFGAYSDAVWSSPATGWVWHKKGRVNPWVFSLRNPKGVQPLLMVPKADQTSLVGCGAGCGPVFGYGGGLIVWDDMTRENNNCSNISHTYEMVSDILSE